MKKQSAEESNLQRLLRLWVDDSSVTVKSQHKSSEYHTHGDHRSAQQFYSQQYHWYQQQCTIRLLPTQFGEHEDQVSVQQVVGTTQRLVAHSILSLGSRTSSTQCVPMRGGWQNMCSWEDNDMARTTCTLPYQHYNNNDSNYTRISQSHCQRTS